MRSVLWFGLGGNLVRFIDQMFWLDLGMPMKPSRADFYISLALSLGIAVYLAVTRKENA